MFRILFIISFIINLALYFEWIDVDQYKAGVDKTVDGAKEIWNDESTQAFISNVKVKVKDLYGEDLENLKTELEDKSKETIQEVIEEKFWTLTDLEQDSVVEYILWEEISEESSEDE